uniref:Uncharacterized protein n=1 Tax=Arundo donax TaxID=35708 RepID=A0A0A9BNA8_ARUDO
MSTAESRTYVRHGFTICFTVNPCRRISAKYTNPCTNVKYQP